MQAQNIYAEYVAADSTQILPQSLALRMGTYPNMQSLLKQREQNLYALQKDGYLEANNLPVIKMNDSTFHLPIYIGNKTNTVQLKINSIEWPNEITKLLKVEKSNLIVVPFSKLEDKITEIHTQWQNHGYSFAEVQMQNITRKNDTLYSALTISANKVRRIDSIIIKGYENFPVKILRHQFGFKPKKKLDQKKIQDATEAIEAMGIAQTTRQPEILYEEEKSTVFLYMEKATNNYFDGIIGFATNEDTGKLEFSGNLDLSLHNNLNQGEKLAINYRADGGDQQDLKINLETPFIANTPISASGGIHIFKKDSTYTNTNLHAKLNYSKRKWSIYLAYEKNKSVNLLEETNYNQNIASLDGNFYFIGTNYTRYQNDLLQPIKTYLDLRLGTGKRETDTNNETQNKTELEGYHTISLGKNHSLYTKIQLKKLWSDDYYSNELYKIGGLDNIRGFNENSIDASQTLLLQTEYRFRLSQEMYIHSIVDVGRIENEAYQIKETIIGLGFGIGIYNKLGLMNLQIANGTMGGEKLDFDKTRIHISLHTKF